MNFSSLSIRNPIPAILLFALLTLAGLLAFQGSGVQDFPDIELPVVTVSASLPGAAPGTLETEVARKLENSIATLAHEVFGIPLPLQELGDWLRGARGLKGSQDGWQIVVEQTMPYRQNRLPRRLEVSRGDVKLTLIVDSWGDGS